MKECKHPSREFFRTCPLVYSEPELVEIFYQDLSLEKQAQLLDLFGLANPSQMNWDVIPLFTMEPPELNLKDMPDEEAEEEIPKKKKGKKAKTQVQEEEPEDEEDEDEEDDEEEL